MRRSAVVYPGEWAIERDDVPDDDRLLAEVERTFGINVKDQVCWKMKANIVNFV